MLMLLIVARSTVQTVFRSCGSDSAVWCCRHAFVDGEVGVWPPAGVWLGAVWCEIGFSNA
jgi:hypothetical protein